MEKYYIMINGEQQGPFTKQEIQGKGFSKDSYIYNKSLGGWKMISEVAGFLSSNTENEFKFKDISPQTTKTAQYQKGEYKKRVNKNWYLKVLNKYSDFTGRARRKEYWLFSLFYLIFNFLAIMIDQILGTATSFTEPILGIFFGIFHGIFVLVMIIPGLAVTARRLHDVGKSGWMYFIGLIPLIGTIWLLVLLLTDSQKGSNKWGVNPKEITT